MTVIERLTPTLKAYDWGLSSDVSFAARFGDPIASTCAEAWWGSHTAGPAHLHSGQPLTDIPYLLKVISVGKALSIQLHPDRESAVYLHQQAPNVYDSRPKPEIAIAITPFTALCGFLPPNEVDANIREVFPNDPDIPRTFRELVESTSPQRISELIRRAVEANPLIRSLEREYPDDAGVLAPLYMHFVELQPGEALVIPPLQPHCYLSGQAVECMASSDNVIRAGLTSKPRDLELFFALVQQDHPEPIVIRPEVTGEFHYQHPCLDFEVVRLTNNSDIDAKDGILVVLGGEGIIGDTTIKSYDSFLLNGSFRLQGDIMGYCARPRE